MDLPLSVLPKLENRRATCIYLPPALTVEVDALWRKHRWDVTGVFANRSWFIETAVRYFLAALPELLDET